MIVDEVSFSRETRLPSSASEHRIASTLSHLRELVLFVLAEKLADGRTYTVRLEFGSTAIAGAVVCSVAAHVGRIDP